MERISRSMSKYHETSFLEIFLLPSPKKLVVPHKIGRRAAHVACRRPEWGSNIIARGRAYRICTKNRWFGPFRATGVFVCAFPGRRCALPWAKMFKPIGLIIASAQGPCIRLVDYVDLCGTTSPKRVGSERKENSLPNGDGSKQRETNH